MLFGTDWLPAGRHLTYCQIVEIVLPVVDELSQAEREHILGGTAARILGL